LPDHLRGEVGIVETERVEGGDEEEAVGVGGAERQVVAPLLVDAAVGAGDKTTASRVAPMCITPAGSSPAVAAH
jgi:hypothetical protein